MQWFLNKITKQITAARNYVQYIYSMLSNFSISPFPGVNKIMCRLCREMNEFTATNEHCGKKNDLLFIYSSLRLLTYSLISLFT